MFLASKLFLVAVHAKIEDKDAIKAGDNNSFFYHVQKNPAHEIDWEKDHILIKRETRTGK